MFAISETNSKNFFIIRESGSGWTFTKDASKATKYQTIEEAIAVKKSLNYMVSVTYWDWDDIVPNAEVFSL